MGYDFPKEETIEHLKLDAVYFPFEDIREYKHLLGMQQHVPISNDNKDLYFAYFKFIKEQCEILLKTDPTHEYVGLWKEAIDEINKIID